MEDVAGNALERPGFAAFYRRWRESLKISDFRHMFTTKADIAKARKVVQASQASRQALTKREREELEKAVWILRGATHRVTGEIIPVWARLGAWPYIGGLPVAAIVLQCKFGGMNTGRLIALHWWNQSMVAGINYYNGSTTIDQDAGKMLRPGNVLSPSVAKLLPSSVQEAELHPAILKLGEAYLVACASAVGIVVGVNTLMKTFPAFCAFAPYAGFPAGSAANAANTFSMRHHELESGIEVASFNGEELGTSRAAAKKAILQTGFTRTLLPAATFILAPLAVAFLKSVTPLGRYLPLYVATMFGCTIGSFAVGLPLCMALFDEESEMNVKDVEPEIQQRLAESMLFKSVDQAEAQRLFESGDLSGRVHFNRGR
mmetsp:Transcript_2361/g.10062  ORF Transcript_2361/g.10062 Transcript_2361/m.10062 type:complete len:374 (-) Transcript_2361:46-1167(-)